MEIRGTIYEKSKILHGFFYTFQIIPDGHGLGTDFLAFAAFLAMVSAGILFQIIKVGAFSLLFIFIHGQIVPDAEILRYVDAEGTWHTVRASGTAVFRTLFVGSGHISYDLLIFQI